MSLGIPYLVHLSKHMSLWVILLFNWSHPQTEATDQVGAKKTRKKASVKLDFK